MGSCTKLGVHPGVCRCAPQVGALLAQDAALLVRFFARHPRRQVRGRGGGPCLDASPMHLPTCSPSTAAVALSSTSLVAYDVRHGAVIACGRGGEKEEVGRNLSPCVGPPREAQEKSALGCLTLPSPRPFLRALASRQALFFEHFRASGEHALGAKALAH